VRDQTAGGYDFESFLAGAAPRLLRFAYLLTGDGHRAEDLVQEALVRTYVAWSRVVREDAFAYTRKILTNLYADWWRSGRWRERTVTEIAVAAPTNDPADEVAQRSWLVAALRGLTARERAVVVLRFMVDLTEADVARELGISVGTVKSTTARALRKLRVVDGDELPLVPSEKGQTP